MEQRIAVVTGANRGLGLQTCRELAQRGHRVVLAGRDRARAEAAARPLQDEGLAVEPAVLDVASEDSVRGFVAHVRETYGRIDVLVNNAGAVLDGHGPEAPELTTPLRVPVDVVRRSLDNNALGAYRLMQAFLPMMNQAGYGRIVNVSSGMGSLSDMGASWPAYRASKVALNAFTILFAHEARGNVKINSVCPGWVRTEMGGPSASRSIEEGVAGIVWAATLPDDGPTGGFFRDGEPVAW